MRSRARALAVASVAGLAACGVSTHARTARGKGRQRTTSVIQIGRSVLGRPIQAFVVGSPSARHRVLVVGCIHGNEPAGEAVTRRLRSAIPPAGVALWIVDELNPDGCHAHTRQNAHGVDLNRNSPWHWRVLDPPGGTYYAGPGPLSEPESRAIIRLVRRLHPVVSIWYHQHADTVDSSGGDRNVERRYARLVGLPFRHLGDFPGSITSWQNATYRRATAFVVELPAGSLSPRSTARHAAAVLNIAHYALSTAKLGTVTANPGG
jgi:murein peptide amidase A